MTLVPERRSAHTLYGFARYEHQPSTPCTKPGRTPPGNSTLPTNTPHLRVRHHGNLSPHGSSFSRPMPETQLASDVIYLDGS